MSEILRTTSSLCPRCKRTIAATIVRDGDRVVMRKRCEAHGSFDVLISSDYDWYAATLAIGVELTPPATTKPVAQGCPYDCGACSQHQQRVELPIVPITSSCNLTCPICYTHNKNDDAFHMSADEMDAILGQIKRIAGGHGERIINITGGEPTAHPDFLGILQQCRDAGIRRVTLSTHGMGLSDEVLRELARLRVRVLLSFDSFEDATNEAMLGGKFTNAKLRTMQRLEEFGVDTTLLPVLARGQNDHELGDFVRYALERDHVRSIEFHTMTFTGQFGASFKADRYTTVDVLRDIETQTNGLLRVDDFSPSPSAHPLCYQVTYVTQLLDGSWIPMPRFMRPGTLRKMLRGALYLEPTPEVQQMMQDVLMQLWTGEVECDRAEDVLAALRNYLERVFDDDIDEEERMRRSEHFAKAIYIHTHMDEHDFDTDRIKQCCVGIVGPDGQNIPSCAYNVIYRNRDPRFMKRPLPGVETLGAGEL